MKRIQISIIVFAVTLLATVSSCKKDNPNTSTCGSGLLCVTVDGTGYTASPYNVTTTGGFFWVWAAPLLTAALMASW